MIIKQCPTMEIERLDNGYVVRLWDGGEDGDQTTCVCEDGEEDDLSSIEDVLWEVIHFFGKGGSRRDAERICVRREVGDKFMDGKEG